MNSYLILSFVLLTIMDYSVDSMEFCEAFKTNFNRISYTFSFNQYINGSTPHQAFIDIIINDNYWRLETNKKHVNQLKFVDPKRNSLPAGPYFGTGFHSIGLYSCCCVLDAMFKWNIGCYAFLFTELMPFVSYGKLKTNVSNPSEITPESFQLNGSYRLNGVSGHPIAIIQTDFRDNKTDKIVFIEYNSASEQLESKAFEVKPFFDFSNRMVTVQPFSLKSYNKLKILNSKIGKFNLLSIVSLYNGTDNDNRGFVLLFENNSELLWCWTHHNHNISDECKPGKLLVNCSSVEIQTTIGSDPTDNSKTTTMASENPMVIKDGTTTNPITVSVTSPNISRGTGVPAKQSVDSGDQYGWLKWLIICVCILIILIIFGGSALIVINKKPTKDSDDSSPEPEDTSDKSKVAKSPVPSAHVTSETHNPGFPRSEMRSNID